MGSILRQTEHIHGQLPHNKNIPEDSPYLYISTLYKWQNTIKEQELMSTYQLFKPIFFDGTIKSKNKMTRLRNVIFGRIYPVSLVSQVTEIYNRYS